MESEMLETPPQVSIKPEVDTVVGGVESSKTLPLPPKLVILADLNANPPESDDPDSLLLPAPGFTSQEKSAVIPKDSDVVEGAVKKSNKKCRSRISKADALLDCGADPDGDQPSQGAPLSREEKVSSLKTGLVHVARKMPKNAHAHFILGLMYQRLGQPQKAFSAYEKATEILLRCETEIARPELLSLVQIHHAQCLLLENSADNIWDKELEHEELDEILSKLKESMQSDIRQAGVWNALGLILLKTGRQQSSTAVLSSLLALAPDNYDCIGNLGIAYRKIVSLWK